MAACQLKTKTLYLSMVLQLRAGIHWLIGIFIDLTKAYETLRHEVVLEKLSSYGIRDLTNLWFKSYLTNRRQYTEINQSDSRNVRISRYRSSCRVINPYPASVKNMVSS